MLQVRRVGATLLRNVNVVDTPGTNVILERQQRLTEEYVPRADLVLFVVSADRPFTESEVEFLQYIRWEVDADSVGAMPASCSCV